MTTTIVFSTGRLQHNASASSDIMCDKSSGGNSSGGDEHKLCTSYEQNVEDCKKDDASDSTSKCSTKKDIKSSSDNVDAIADGIGMVHISGKDTDKDSAINQVVEKGDQNHFLTSAQDEISSIYSKQRNRIDNNFKGIELSEPEKTNHPNFVLFKTKVYELINEEEIKNRQLFQDPLPKEDCPICMLPMPFCGELDGRFRFSYQFFLWETCV